MCLDDVNETLNILWCVVHDESLDPVPKVKRVREVFEQQLDVAVLPWNSMVSQMKLAFPALYVCQFLDKSIIDLDWKDSMCTEFVSALTIALNRYRPKGNALFCNDSVPLESDYLYDDVGFFEAGITTVHYATRHLMGIPRKPWNPETAGNTPCSTKGAAPRTYAAWGQRKLMMCEIEFLTRFVSHNLASGEDGEVESIVVLYIGAGAGFHIPLLAGLLFPQVQFELYDPVPFAFCPESLGLSNVRIHQDYFTDEDVDSYRQLVVNGKKKLLFISDIRRLQDDEVLVKEDNALQANWLCQIQPYASMLKFRLPYPEEDLTTQASYLPCQPRQGDDAPDTKVAHTTCGEDSTGICKDVEMHTSTVYLRGEIWLQPYGRAFSSETRLVVQSKEAERVSIENEKAIGIQDSSFRSRTQLSSDKSSPFSQFCIYDHSVYQDKCFYVNSEIRTQHIQKRKDVLKKRKKGHLTHPPEDLATSFRHGVEGAGLDESWDCAVEVDILRKYIEKFGHERLYTKDMASTLSNELTIAIGGEKSGMNRDVSKHIAHLSRLISDELGWKDAWIRRQTRETMKQMNVYDSLQLADPKANVALSSSGDNNPINTRDTKGNEDKIAHGSGNEEKSDLPKVDIYGRDIV